MSFHVPNQYRIRRGHMAGAINDEVTGGLFVCCQPTCPYEAKVLENYGETMSFGRPHTVHLRLLEPVEAAQ